MVVVHNMNASTTDDANANITNNVNVIGNYDEVQKCKCIENDTKFATNFGLDWKLTCAFNSIQVLRKF